ncbi:hypothetical protein STREPTOSP366_29400 [Streptomyces variabilis]
MIDIPAKLAEAQIKFNKEAGRAFIAALPDLAADFMARWDLRPAGTPMHGVSALVLPVDRADGTPAVLKLQLRDHESEGEPIALRLWNGDGAVRLLDHDEPTGTMLLERLDSSRMLARTPDVHGGVLVIARLLAHLHATPAPPGMRHLGGIAASMLERTPAVLDRIPDPEARRLVADCAAACARSRTSPATGCSTGTCTTRTSSPPTACPGSPSTPSRSPATPASTCGPPSPTTSTPATSCGASTR